ncbi:phosphotransferase enzyme family protein [Nocardia sp. NPDC051750]|uniref:phosphotransferase enzyme family protein n=1 Tax=Nocardia sp. NPDC051750 TaxID=3364325 RepID=UPI00379EDA35
MPDRSQDFVPEVMEAIARTACRQVGLPADDLQFLRLGQNILYHLPGPAIVVRIARDSSYRADALKEIAVAEWLADEEVPAARVFDIGREQPIETGGHPVTFWHYLPGRTATGDEASVTAALLGRLHRLPAPKGIEIPVLHPLARVEHRIHCAPIPERDKEFLVEETKRLESQLDDLTYVLPAGVNHGDAHIKNVIVSPSGTGGLIDFEAVNLAHHEWDLAKTATEAAMGMLPAPAYARFAAEYGYDLMRWDGFATVCSVMQLRMVTWLAQNVGHTDAIADEYSKRMRTLRHGFTENWSGF